MAVVYLLKWSKARNTWYVDIEGIGRYSVRRHGTGPFRAYLNNVHIESVDGSKDVEMIKRTIEERVTAAKIIAGKESDLPLKKAEDYDRRTELISAARAGIGLLLSSTRGGAMFGALHAIVETKTGFCVVYGNDNRFYFDITEM